MYLGLCLNIVAEKVKSILLKLIIVFVYVYLCEFILLQHVVDAVLSIQRKEEPIDLHMVEIMEMLHQTDMDTM